MADLDEPSILSEICGSGYPDETPVWQRLQTSVIKYGNRTAVTSLHQPSKLYGIGSISADATHLCWSYGMLTTAVDRIAFRLEKNGIQRGTPLATILPNGVEFIIVLWAAHKLGCPLVPMSAQSLVKTSETAQLLGLAGVKGVIVQDIQVAKRIDALDEVSDSPRLKIVIAQEPPASSWLSFENLMEPISALSPVKSISETSEDDVVAIFFTSGTTSVPKGVLITNSNVNAISQSFRGGRESAANIFCAVLPNNYAYAHFATLHFMMHGSAIVYPSPSFDALAMIGALEAEMVTHTTLVPTALHALLERLQARGSPLRSCLADVCLGGSGVSPDDVRRVIRELASHGVSTLFGMTEGPSLSTLPQSNPEDLINGDLTIAGAPSLGASIRICAPGSKVPIPRGERGELHHCGPELVKAYLGEVVGSDAFYADEHSRTWFITGDQGIMLTDGRVCKTGRYKDMIIRGGVNITPAAIESMLNEVCGVQAQVVGVPDQIAGEVPVVVLEKMELASSKVVQEAVLHHLGSSHVPDEIVTLAMLGIAEFPKTLSGKVQKAKLAELVSMYRKQIVDHPRCEELQSVRSILLRAYYKATGIPVAELNLEASITDFADSIMVMRVRDHMRKELGWTMSAEQMAKYPSIASQLRLLHERTPYEQFSHHTAAKASGPPSIEQMRIQFGGSKAAKRMKTLVEKTIEADGFDWSNDVASLITTYDLMQMLLESRCIDSWNFGCAILTSGSTKEHLRVALERTLGINPLFVSYYVTGVNQMPYYITLHPSTKLWDLCIIDRGSVETIKDVQNLAMNYPHPEHSRAPGPLLRCLVMDVKETRSAAMVTNVHHLVHDALSMKLFLDDLNSSLLDTTKPARPHVDYQAWADSYQALRLSPLATTSVNYHVKRLSSLHLHRNALYPAAPLPRQAITSNPDGHDYAFDCPNLLTLKRSHPGITAAVVLKAALALVNVNRTNSTHALFINFEAGRHRFPFIPASLESRNPSLFEATDVNGPTMESVTNMIAVPRSTPALAFLKNLQAEQLKLTEHAHAPLLRVIEALNADGSGAGDVIIETHRTQAITWVPGFMGEHERIQCARLAIRPVLGLVFMAGLGGPKATTYHIFTRWDVANYSLEKTRAFVGDLEAAALWLTDERHWGLTVGVLLRGWEGR